MEVFGAYQILEMAARIEEVGIEFYTQLKDLTSKPNLRKLFADFSQKEAEHKKFFLGIADQLKRANYSDVYPMDFYNYVDSVVKAIEVLALDPNNVSLPLNEGKIADIAIQLETKSVEVYTKIYDTLGERIGGALSRIIDEEKEHLMVFSDLKQKIS